jgi:hypothetical protein
MTGILEGILKSDILLGNLTREAWTLFKVNRGGNR